MSRPTPTQSPQRGVAGLGGSRLASGGDGRPGAGGAAPLWATCWFTVLNSIGTGIFTNGVFFLAQEAYGFGRLENYALGVLLGVTYIAGALGVGPLLRRLCERVDWISHRLALAAIMATLAGLCLLPWAAAGFSDREGAGGAWAVWVLIGLYGPLTGALWPIVESYVSGGRRGGVLRDAIGLWNIVWSASVAASLWLVAPLVEPAPRAVLAGLGAVCLAAAAFLPAMGRDPGRHLEETSHEVPRDYERHLAVFRILLPVSYFVASALGPNLPTALERLGVAPGWRTPLAATWMVIRVPVFAVLAHWHGWHGKWWMPMAGAGSLAAGFALSVLGPSLLVPSAPGVGIVVLEVGLALVGAGMSLVYVGALYYVSAARHGSVGAGGSHEALIGTGYLGGPVCGLMAAAGVEAGLMGQGAFGPVVLGLVGLVILVAGGVAWRRGRRPS